MGIHLTGDFENCLCNSEHLLNSELARVHLEQFITNAGLTVVTSQFHSFGDNQGYTGAIVLAESHVCVHTWPESFYVNADVFVCNHTKNNEEAAKRVFEDLCKFYNPVFQNKKILSRIPKTNIAWGFHTILKLEGCTDLIKDETAIKKYVVNLCDLIKMKRFGDCVTIDFGEDKSVSGFSMFQLIETSNISGHFVNQDNSAHIDIFSCKEYDIDLAIKFSAEFFGATRVTYNYLER